jgi:beta-glucosidase
MSEQFKFPKGFLWGAATASYQIEGSPLADGAGPSIWHRFSHTPGNTANGDTGDVACDHYYRYASDVSLMKELGLQTYRFSIAWPRILPEGKGRINQAGMDFYTRLIDLLLENGIIPNVTLYHWDLPAALNDLGGWVNPDIADWFGDYASTMFDKLGDRVPMWSTLNEPAIIMDLGFVQGVHAPGHRDLFEAARVTHNLLRAHGRAVQAYRGQNRSGNIGLVVSLEPRYEASDSPEDMAAARRMHAWSNSQYLDPVFFGKYPDELEEIFRDAWISPTEDDMKLISQPIDFVGVNYYTRSVVQQDATRPPFNVSRIEQKGNPHTDMGWEVYPPALTDILKWIHSRYNGVAIYITENGSAWPDPPTAIDGRIEDPLRIDYLVSHLKACLDAINQGVNLRGYYAWSLLDNFEWAFGYAKRFGLVHVDYETQQRTIKETGRFYSKVIESNGVSLD